MIFKRIPVESDVKFSTTVFVIFHFRSMNLKKKPSEICLYIAIFLKGKFDMIKLYENG